VSSFGGDLEEVCSKRGKGEGVGLEIGTLQKFCPGTLGQRARHCSGRRSSKAHGLTYSALNKARFSTVEDGKEETFGLVVVWIAVHPNTTSAVAVGNATSLSQ